MSDANPNSIRTTSLPVIAHATSQKHDAIRWTSLTIWYRDSRRPFLVEVFGGTKAAGEQQRRRRRVYATLEEALDFLEPGRLADEMRSKARAWWKLNGNDKSMMPAKASNMGDA